MITAPFKMCVLGQDTEVKVWYTYHPAIPAIECNYPEDCVPGEPSSLSIRWILLAGYDILGSIGTFDYATLHSTLLAEIEQELDDAGT